jgi:hypothetical protein
MDRYYTDEDLDFGQDDWSNGFDDAYGLPPGTDSVHNWDYFEPEDEEPEQSFDFGNRQADRYDDRLPKQLCALLKMIREQPWQITAAKSFYEQALFMQDYEDDAGIVGYMNYFPTYRDMTIHQLRSYFTIRKQLRLGKAPDVSLSYLFVYVYETLMRIGVNTAEEGYEILCALKEAYSESEPKFSRYLTPWIRDYVVYNNLSEHFSEVFAKEQEQDKIADVLADYAKCDPQLLFDTICPLSKYDPRTAALYKKFPKETTEAMVRVLRAILPTIEKESRHRIRTMFAGKRVSRSCTMFANAVFYDPKPVRNVEIAVSPAHRFICRGGLWSHDDYVGADLSLKKKLGAVLRETDRQLREMLGVKPKLPLLKTGEEYSSLIKPVLASWQAEEQKRRAAEEAEKRRISIDYSKLGRIRNDAEVVQDKLLEGVVIDEEVSTSEELTSQSETVVAGTRPATAPDTDAASETPAESREHHFLRLYLSGGDWKQFLRDIHVPEGVMVENINNEMMDIVGDIVLEDNGDGLQLIEDYREDILNLLNNSIDSHS